MDKQNFTLSMTVDQTPQEVFDAINNIRAWWTGDIEGNTDKPGAEFTYRYKELHYSKQKVTEFVPAKKIVWHVLDSNLSFIEDKNEWKGTDITFEIAKNGARTEVRFTHAGLVPECECYDACSGGWTSLIDGGLKHLITTGESRRIAL